MENKFKQFINDNKGFVVFYLIWFLLQLFFVSVGGGGEGFWPFTTRDYSPSDRFLGDYGIIEFVFYIISPIVIWAIWKLIGNDVKNQIK